MSYQSICAANPAGTACPFDCPCQGHYKAYPNQACQCPQPELSDEDAELVNQAQYNADPSVPEEDKFKDFDQIVTEEALRRYNSDKGISEVTGEEAPIDDWGYAQCERNAFTAGVKWYKEWLENH